MRNALFAAFFGLAALLALPAGAMAAQPYSPSAFQEAQKSGKTILLHVTAPWCSTCRAQHPILANIAQRQPGVVAFDIDFDTQKDLLRKLRVQSQSTVIVFKGDKEVGRSTGDTNAGRLGALVAKGL